MYDFTEHLYVYGDAMIISMMMCIIIFLMMFAIVFMRMLMTMTKRKQ